MTLEFIDPTLAEFYTPGIHIINDGKPFRAKAEQVPVLLESGYFKKAGEDEPEVVTEANINTDKPAEAPAEETKAPEKKGPSKRETK